MEPRGRGRRVRTSAHQHGKMKTRSSEWRQRLLKSQAAVRPAAGHGRLPSLLHSLPVDCQIIPPPARGPTKAPPRVHQSGLPSAGRAPRAGLETRLLDICFIGCSSLAGSTTGQWQISVSWAQVRAGEGAPQLSPADDPQIPDTQSARVVCHLE